MLINLASMLRMAEEKKIAIGSFNVYNVESLQGVWRAARETETPVIISFGEFYDKHMPLEGMAALVKEFVASSPLPAVLHLDHSREKKTILRALAAGFTSVMFDGSALPLEENIRRSRDLAETAHLLDASLEGELGYLNPEDGTEADAKPVPGGDDAHGCTGAGAGRALFASACMEECTRVSDARRYAEESGADALAVAIGNAHGIYKGTPHLDFGRLEEIRRAASIPLVLHGSSGIPEELLQRAIRLGIRKVNINTEVSTRGVRAAREFLKGHKDPNTRFEAVAKAAEEEMAKAVKECIAMFSPS